MISYQKVILKMAEEIKQANETTDQAKIIAHTRAIKLLAELILDDHQLDDEAAKLDKTVADELELRKMLGENYQPKQKLQQTIHHYDQPDSLLDF
ncbi:YwdI family protein [Amphibacillus sp. MSJ-3]|uniref:DUF5327 family protein n=1 Tax=Amphibacillus sp. MSJ-3 TaxID=2841505 RepID=UPI001C0F2ABC|nr:DUF5327 family protein [Amphibacillus sp. MSJ-3]MBU5594827.1 YwdI family protein [Amphibacillus sp. MSJ-3]